MPQSTDIQPSETLLHLAKLYEALGMAINRESACSYALRLPNALDAIGTLSQQDSTINIKYAFPFSEIETMMPNTLIIPDAQAIAEGFLGVRGIGCWVDAISNWYGIPKNQIQYDSKSITIQLE